MFATGNGRKTDPVGAHSVALAALRSPNLVTVEVDPELVVLGLLADRRAAQAIDRKIKACKKEITALFQAQGSTLLELHGIGPSSAARLTCGLRCLLTRAWAFLSCLRGRAACHLGPPWCAYRMNRTWPPVAARNSSSRA